MRLCNIYPHDMHDWSSRFEASCEDLGISVVDALKEAAVAPSTLWRWKSGRFEPRAKTLRLLEGALEKLRLERRG